MKIAILGYGVEGQAAVRYFRRQRSKVKGQRFLSSEPEITICDAKTDLELPEGVQTRLGPDYLQDLDGFDLIVRSPGVRPDLIRSSAPVTSVTREFMAQYPAPIIGVTGTKGKGTAATLIAKILEADGHKVWLGGNIGTPALDFLDKVKPTDWVVLELSSFQLMDVTQSPQVAVGLMIAPDHLDYHLHMEEYIQAKGNIYRFQTKSDLAVYCGGQPETKRLVQLSPGRHISYCTPEGAYVRDGRVMFRDEEICKVNEVGLIGRHNLENVCAAVAATHHLVKDAKARAKAIREFKGLPHRLEEVRVLAGVRYINDSFAANPTAAEAGVKAFAEPKVLILGGFDRGMNQMELAQAVAESNVRKVLLIGQMAPKLAKLLEAEGYKRYKQVAGGMVEIVAAARAVAEEGDVVLLSPGSPSFDMFKNFADRGERFRAAVESLK